MHSLYCIIIMWYHVFKAAWATDTIVLIRYNDADGGRILLLSYYFLVECFVNCKGRVVIIDVGL